MLPRNIQINERENGAKRSTNRERFTSPPTWHPFVTATAAGGAAAVCRSVGVACLAGHAANKRAATATAATATAAAKQRPRPDAMRSKLGAQTDVVLWVSLCATAARYRSCR